MQLVNQYHQNQNDFMSYSETVQLLQFLWIVMVLMMAIPLIVIFTQVYLEHRRNKKIEHTHRFYLKEKYKNKDIREWDK